jgi:deoxyribodipyrimidine photo-lyase
MLWGKSVLAWSRSPRAALATLIELNNKYAVDGRDPSSYSGIA